LKAIDILSSELKEKDIFAIVSMGKAFDLIQLKIKSGLYKKPHNIHLVPSAPQISILKRATLFITHCGQNSVNESIHFGVPMICLAQSLDSDQMLVSEIVSRVLALGIELESAKFKPIQLTESIKTILKEKVYLERITRLSVLSKHYNGSRNAANHIKAIIDSSSENGSIN
jgi:UDP:flavonoid glycosyltransferase YjiC (YdhE family)